MFFLIGQRVNVARHPEDVYDEGALECSAFANKTATFRKAFVQKNALRITNHIAQ